MKKIPNVLLCVVENIVEYSSHFKVHSVLFDETSSLTTECFHIYYNLQPAWKYQTMYKTTNLERRLYIMSAYFYSYQIAVKDQIKQENNLEKILFSMLYIYIYIFGWGGGGVGWWLILLLFL